MFHLIDLLGLGVLAIEHVVRTYSAPMNDEH